MGEWLGLQAFAADDFLKLAFRLILDLTFAGLVVRQYRKLYGPNDYVFTYLVFNVITFTLAFLLRKVPIELGFALGLFAVFGILRYRTEPIRTRDLTYLFIVIGIAILNAVANKKVSLAELLLVNVAIVGLTLVVEQGAARTRLSHHRVLYDDLILLRGGDDAALRHDLSQRTGLVIQRVEVERFDLLRDTADLRVFYHAPSGEQA